VSGAQLVRFFEDNFVEHRKLVAAGVVACRLVNGPFRTFDSSAQPLAPDFNTCLVILQHGRRN